MIELKEHNIEPYRELCGVLEESDMVGYESATGTGKTYVIGKYIEEFGIEKSTLIIVPSNVIRDSWTEILGGVDIITYQYLLNNDIDTKRYGLIVCDEMHHLGADKWGGRFKELTENYVGKVIGTTATPVRFLDNARDMIEEAFGGNRVIGLQLPDAISKGILPSFDYITALYGPSDKKKRIRGSDEKRELTEKLYSQLDTYENERSFQNIMKKHFHGDDHKVAVFVPNINKIKEYKSVIQSVFPEAVHIVAHSSMSSAKVEKAFSKFKASKGRNCFFYTVNILNEGAHIDGVDTVIMFRRTESPNIFLQQLGRALTANSRHEKITVFDFVANHANIKVGTQSTESVIDWINDAICDPERQIIKTDYTKAELELLGRIRDLQAGVLWSDAEDEILKKYYGQKNHKEKLLELLPSRSWGGITMRANLLGIAKKKSRYRTKELVEDVKALYLRDGGIDELKDKYPVVPSDAIRRIAVEQGLCEKRKPLNWTEEEDEIIKSNSEDTEKLVELLPGRSVEQIRARRNKLGLSKHLPIMTDADKQVIVNNKDLSTSEITRRFFPDRSTSFIMKWRVKLNACPPEQELFWDDEKNRLFEEAYVKGGSKAVMEIDVFRHLSRKQISQRARHRGIKTEKRSAESCVRYTEDEIEILRQWVEQGEFHNKDEIEKLFPEHTVGSVRCKMRKMGYRKGKACESTL